ncbi:acyl-CoA thioesterase [Alkalihalobacterium elongatum]|uniref:acyl-CoA thioesterase n=1 Tax=Alkalihalobacterium elongatum TaxID=2675466 RepID=UPI001C1FDE33|nr:thioesterase family protein [Alkalihalobacterium elongatum]
MSNISYIENLEEWKETFSFYCPIKVRFSETDAFGHLNNTKVFVYFEEARIEYFKSLGLMKDWMTKENDAIIVTADLQCNYIRQLFFDEKIKVYVNANHIGNTSVDIHYMALNESGELCLTGRGSIVQISKQTGKPLPWSEAIIDKMKSNRKKIGV